MGIGGITLSGFLSYNGRKRLLIQKPTSGGDSNFYIVSTAFVGSIDNVLVYESLPKKLTVDNGILSKEIILSTNPATATGTPDILVFENSSVPVKKIPYSYISRPYKSYSFLATQSGTGNPSITTLENQLSTTGVWTRTGAGAYQISLSVPIDAGKCISPQHSTVCTREFIGGKYQLYVRALSTTELQILVKSEDGSTDIDDMLLNKPIEFRVYN